ncbi:hypothetical protein Q2T76_01975 [Lactobacillus sp. YT155]|uniref:hypothetical protein n=1 Tax=Lactobacillus sp. YT155 TaxID=3060955 RepID=UPI00265EFCB9|nr:hypothetical protein [Lactobacillus sp. YT155]MDO1604817.1 hypothetical protein [Lactobacillus sp. YT155]
MTKKVKIIVTSIVVIILIMTGYFLFFTSKSDRLTVTDIHDKVIFGETTKKDIENRYGKPKKTNRNIKKVNEVFEYWNGYEGGVNYMLEQNTNYFETEKADHSSMKKYFKSIENAKSDIYYDSYIEYEGKNLGANYVRFFLYKGMVRGVQYGGEITDDGVAKKDKYLKQLYGD